MSQLDLFVGELKTNFDLGNKSKVSPEANKFHYLITKAKKEGNMDEVLRLVKESRKIG